VDEANSFSGAEGKGVRGCLTALDGTVAPAGEPRIGVLFALRKLGGNRIYKFRLEHAGQELNDVVFEVGGAAVEIPGGLRLFKSASSTEFVIDQAEFDRILAGPTVITLSFASGTSIKRTLGDDLRAKMQTIL